MRTVPLIIELIETQQRSQMIEITDLVQRLVRQHQVDQGLAIVFVPHTTAAVSINENADPDVQRDLLEKLRQMIPQMESYYQHDEGNSDSHVKTSLTGSSTTLMVEGGEVVLGRWQGLYFMEFDGPRERRIMVKLVSFVDRADRGPMLA